VLTGPRVLQRMAADGLLPRPLSRSPDAPGAAITAQVCAAVVVLWSSELSALLGYLGLTLGLCSAATVAGLMRHRQRLGPARVPIPGHPWIPLAFVSATLASALLLALRSPAQAVAAALTAAAGLPVYAWLHPRSEIDSQNGAHGSRPGVPRGLAPGLWWRRRAG